MYNIMSLTIYTSNYSRQIVLSLANLNFKLGLKKLLYYKILAIEITIS